MTDISQWTIILVDDEPDSLNLISELLTLHNAEVLRAANGEACLALLSEVKPTVLVVDLNMPRPDGWDVLNGMRAMSDMDGVPVIAVTAYYSDAVEEEAYRAGFDAFVRKPVKTVPFLTMLQDLVAQ
ncbi:MAG: response regulator [Anaerolineae bacterium]|nr:response regulator [Anaerolineae bacterium]